jgi:hypothetical protein
MRIPLQRFSLSLVIFSLGVTAAGAQEHASGPRNSLSVRGGFAWALGDWTQHPYAPVSYFKQDLVVGGDVAFTLSDKTSLAVTGCYLSLNTVEWDEYARSMGDEVTSSASMGFVAIVLRLYLKNSAPDLVSLDIGPLMLFAGGEEKFFNYDFLASPRFGGLAAIEYDRMLGENYAAYLRVAGAWVPSALQYADGWSPTLVTVPVTIGVRVLL